MIRAAIICPDQLLASKLQQALAAFRNVGVGRVLHQYPNEAKLQPFLQASLPEMIFLSVESVRDAADVALRVEALAPGTPIVGVGPACDGAAMLTILRAGVRDFVPAPFEPHAIYGMLMRVEAALDRMPEASNRKAPVFAFLPAKAGAGTTTIAVNTSVALARIPNNRPLLIDLDLSNGLVQFMLSLNPRFTITEAAENAPEMDETIWSKVVTSVFNLDILPAGIPRADFRIEPSHVRRILEYAARNYSVVSVDLSGMMERYSVEVMREARQIFLVCTPEVPSLHLARTKLDMLDKLELADKVSILINRSDRRVPGSAMEGVFQKKVILELPNAYAATKQASMEGKPVDMNSPLGKSFSQLARIMMPAPKTVVERRRGLFDLFKPLGSKAPDAA